MPAEALTTKRRSTTLDALMGLSSLAVAALVIAMLYFARSILVPLAVSVLLTFLLTPLATRLERRIGRVFAVIGVVLLTTLLALGTGWGVARQLEDFAQRLPDYQSNVQAKLHAVSAPASASNLTETLGGQLKRTLPDVSKEPSASSLGKAAFILLLVVSMLLRRESLRSRLVRLLGQGQIGATTQAWGDAGAKVSGYLLKQLTANLCFSVPLAVSLYFMGVPHAVLWGALALLLRFIPYIGSWISGLLAVTLSVAISTGWAMPLLTAGLFIGLDFLVKKLVEPAIHLPHTGVSSVALVVAAFFWTCLWGFTGLLLAAPLTVCLVVMSRHVPRLRFLSILLSDQQSLAPAEECYQQLLALDMAKTSEWVNEYVQKNSLTSLYDAVLIPVVSAAEMDHQREILDDQQRQLVEESVGDFLEDLGTRSFPPSQIPLNRAPDKAAPAWRFLSLPVRDLRDELAGSMLVHLLREHGFQSENLSPQQVSGEMAIAALNTDWDAVCISVVPPTTVLQARYLCMKLRSQSPALKIAVGLWGTTENLADATERLREAGADEVMTTLADAVTKLTQLAPPAEQPMIPAPIPANETRRLEALCELHLINGKTEPYFDRTTRKLTRVLDVPIALVTLVDRDRQIFKGQTGLPEELAMAGESPRETSVCAHVVADDEPLIVEDVRRDLRFAANPLLKQYGIRFYAGVPLRAPDGQPVGSLSILDTQPRRLTERDLRLLHVIAEDVTEEIARHAGALEAKTDQDDLEQIQLLQ